MWSGNSSNPFVNGAAKLIVIALVILGLYHGRDLLIPLALAGIVSFILFPLVAALTNRGVPQGIAVTVVVTALTVTLLGGITVAGRQVAQVLEEVPKYETNLREKARDVHALMGGTGIWQRAMETLRNVEQEILDPQAESKPLKIEVAPTQPLSTFLEFTRSTLPSIATAGLSIVMTIFILLQYRELRDRIVRLMGVTEIGRSTQALNKAGVDVAHFLLLQTGLNLSFGVFIAAALWLIGVPSPGLWGAMAALMRFVPYVGSVLSGVFPIALAAMVDSGWWMLVESAAVYIGGDILVGQLVEPLVFGSRTHLSSIAVVFGAAFWTLLWGPAGLILAVPLTLTIVVIGQHVPHLEFLRILLGNKPVLEPHQKLYRELLVGDTTEAAKDAGRCLESGGYLKYLDETAIACLQIAADDRQRGVLAKGQVEDLRVILPEYIAQVRELLDFRREQHRTKLGEGERQERALGDGDLAEGDKGPSASFATAVVIAARGIIDHAAAELIADAIRFELAIPTECAALGGLTGIATAAEATEGASPDVVILVSVGEVTAGQLALLVRRAKRAFEGSAIAIGYWGGSNVAESLGGDADGRLVVTAETVGALVDSIRRIVNERAMKPHRPPPLKLA